MFYMYLFDQKGDAMKLGMSRLVFKDKQLNNQLLHIRGQV